MARFDEAAAAGQTRPVTAWIYFLHPPRDDFAATMTADEKTVWAEHFQRLQGLLDNGQLILAGPTLGTVNIGSPAYAEDRHFLTRAGAAWLADHDAALVGIDALNIDDTADGERPAHTLLLAAGIPVVEHLTGLGQLPVTGAWFTAAPVRIEKLGTIPVRAFARLPG
jgi:kynurenine formamidase